MLASLALLLAQPAVAENPVPIPPIDEARKQVIRHDADLFWAAFEGCEPQKLEPLLTEDFRMLHDLAGLAVDGRAGFITSMEEQCANREPGGQYEGYKNRRLAVPGSRTVTPLGEWGVLEHGMHTFHEWRGQEKGWEQTGGARYIHVWQWMADEGRFRLQESLSIDHDMAVPYPP